MKIMPMIKIRLAIIPIILILSGLFSFSYASENSASRFEIPAIYGKIDSEKHSEKAEVTFVLINDFHYNYQAQDSIARVIEYLVKDKGYRLVLTEGGSGNLNLSHLRCFAPKEITEKICAKYLKNGLISGEEYLNIVSDYDFIIEGIENQDLYSENVKAFFETIDVRNKFDVFLCEMENTLSELKNNLFPKKFLEIEELRRKFARDSIALENYVISLSDFCKSELIDLEKYEEFNKFAGFIAFFSKIDEIKLRKEINEYLNKVISNNPPNNRSFKKLYAAVKYESIDSIIGKIQELTGNTQVDITEFEYINIVVAKYGEFKKLSIETVYNQIKNLEAELVEVYLKEKDLKEINEISESADIFRKLIELKLSKEEFAQYKLNIDKFQPETWVNKLKTISENQLITVKLPDTGFITFDLLGKIDNFYNLAVKRDEYLLENAINLLRDYRENKAIVVTGGFHKDRFIRHFQKSAVNYAVISPKFNTHEATCDYLNVFNLKNSYLDLQATRGTQIEAQLATELRNSAMSENYLLPQLERAVKSGKAVAIKDIQSANLDDIFSGSPDEIAVALTKDIEGVSDDIIESLARRLRSPPGEQLIKRIYAGFKLIKENLAFSKNSQEIADKYMIVLDQGNETEFVPAEDNLLRPIAGANIVYFGLKTIDYALSSNETIKRFRRVLFRDALNINSTLCTIPAGNEYRNLRIFWKGARAFVTGQNYREYTFRRTGSNTESNFAILDQNDLIIVENMDKTNEILAVNKTELKGITSTQRLSKRIRNNVALLPFFADGVGSSIRWIHAIKGIREKNPDEYLSIILFDIPQNREFTAQQVRGAVDEIIWIDPKKPLLGEGASSVFNHYRIKDAHRVLWEILIQQMIDQDPSIIKSYPFELFIQEYDFSQHHPDLKKEQTTVYASAFFETDKPAEIKVSDDDIKVADDFYEKLGFNPDEEIVIAYSLRIDMTLTDAIRNTNLYDTIKFIKMLQTKVISLTNKPPKIIFFGNSPSTFADQLLEELGRMEKLTDDEAYLDRIRSLTFDLINTAQQLQMIIDSDPNLIDFTNVWKLKDNKFKKTFTLSQQAAILERASFATGTNSGALDIPLARGVPGVRLTEYHYLGYNEFLANDFTLNIYVRHDLRTSKSSFVNMVANRSGIETYLNFLASTPIQNDPATVSKAYDEMLSYVISKRIRPDTPKPENLYRVKRKDDVYARTIYDPYQTNPRQPPSKLHIGLTASFARWGIEGLDEFLKYDVQSASRLLSDMRIDLTYHPGNSSYQSLKIPVYFGFHSPNALPSENYVVVITPDDKVPYKSKLAQDTAMLAYLNNADRILVWDKNQYRTIVSAVPSITDKLTLVDEFIPPVISGFLLSLPKNKYDHMAGQILAILDSMSESIIKKWEEQENAKHTRIIQDAINRRTDKYQIKSLEDYTWGHKLGEKLIEYFTHAGDAQAVDDINYVGIWLVTQTDLQLDDPVPFLFRVKDYIEIQGENIKRGYGTNIFVSESALYKAYLAISNGAPIKPLAELLRLQAQVVRISASGGFNWHMTGLLADQTITEDDYVDIFGGENELIAEFVRAYHLVVADITPGIKSIQPESFKDINPAGLRLVESSL